MRYLLILLLLIFVSCQRQDEVLVTRIHTLHQCELQGNTKVVFYDVYPYYECVTHPNKYRNILYDIISQYELIYCITNLSAQKYGWEVTKCEQWNNEINEARRKSK